MTPPRMSAWSSSSRGKYFSALTVGSVVLFLWPPQWDAFAGVVWFFFIACLALSWFFNRQALTPAPFPASPKIFLAFTGLLLIWILSLLTSREIGLGLNQVTQDLALALLLFSVWMTAPNTEKLTTALGWILGVAGLLALYGVYQSAYGLESIYHRLFAVHLPLTAQEQAVAHHLISGRAFALFANPNLFGGFLATLFPVSCALWLNAFRSSPLSGERENASSRVSADLSLWFYSFVIGLLLAGLYASRSLGSWLAAWAGLGCWVTWVGKDWKNQTTPWFRRGLILAVLSVGAGGLWLLVITRGGSAAVLEHLQQRMTGWLAFWPMIRAHALLGIGPGGLMVNATLPYAHQFLVQRLAETGVLGLGAFLWFLGTCFWIAMKKTFSLKELTSRTLALGLLASLMASCLHASIDLDFEFLKTASLFWYLLGAWLGLVTHAQRISSAPMELRASRVKIEWLVAGLAMLLVWKGGRSLWVEGILCAGAGVLVFIFLCYPQKNQLAWKKMINAIPLRWPLICLLAWGLVSALLSAHPAGAISTLGWAVIGLLFYGVVVLTPGIGTLLLRVLSLLSTLMAAVALVFACLEPGIRVSAGWPNANLLAAFLAMGVLVNLSLLWSPLSRPYLYWKYGLSAGLGFLGLIFTGSLGGVVNLLLGLAIGLLLKKHWEPIKKTSWIIGSLIFILGIMLFLSFGTGKRILGLSRYEGSGYERIGMARAAWHMASARPWSGYGPGNFEAGFENYKFTNQQGLAQYGKTTAFAHNEFLQIAAVLGLPGLLLLLWLLAAIVKKGKKFYPDSQTDAVRWAAWAALAGACGQALVDFNWHLPALLVWGMILLALALKPQAENQEKNISPHYLPPVQGLPAWGLGLVISLAMSIAIRPMISDYFIQRGEALRFKQNLEAAVQDFRSAILTNPFTSQAYDQLGQVYADLYAFSGQEQQYTFSSWSFQQALGLNHQDAYIHRHLGMLYSFKASRSQSTERLQAYSEAEKQYQAAIAKAPFNAILYFELGNLLRDTYQMDKAEMAWKKAVLLEPHYAAAWINLGVAQDMREDLAGAEKTYRQALALRRLAPYVQGKYEIEILSIDWTIVHYNLAHMLEQEGRWPEALAEYQKVLDLEPNNANVLKHLKFLRKTSR